MVNLFTLFGIKSADKSVEELVKLTNEEYFSRFVRIKNAVENNPVILENINNAFCTEYLGKKLDKKLLRLGLGYDNSVYSIYDGSVTDNEYDVSLALRLKRVKKEDTRFYKLKDASGENNFQLFSELNSFCKSFVGGVNPPYFTGLVEWCGPGRFEEGVVGLITEDVTKRLELKSSLKRDAVTDYLQVTSIDGEVTEFIIDTMMPRGYTSDVLKYRDNPIKVDYSLYISK